MNCSSPYSPWRNICPSTNKTCTADDPEVNAVEIDKFGGHATYEMRNNFYKGPAYNVPMEKLTHWNGEQMWETKDELRTMVNDRFEVQKTADCGAMCHNELILDERLMLTQLWWDPATVVSAFIYFRGDSGARSQAITFQKAFKEDWGVEPPLVAVDAGCEAADAACGPFHADSAETVV